MNADDFRALTECWARVMEENRDRLIELDSVVGDSDLGLTMSDGFRAAANAVKGGAETDVGKVAYQAGRAMASAVPSTMGTKLEHHQPKALDLPLLPGGGVTVFVDDALHTAARFVAYAFFIVDDQRNRRR